MSLTELKRGAAKLPAKERRELTAFLLQLSRTRNRAWRAEMSRRMREMDAGKKVTQEEFERRIGLRKA
jgi:hypothetical protein